MTFNIETLADQAGTQGQPNQEPSVTDNVDQGAGNGITEQKLAEILKRDEHAQQHIKTLEEENTRIRNNFSSLQEQLELLQGKLDSRLALEQLLSGKNTSKDTSTQTGEPQGMENKPSAMGIEDIDSLVNQRIEGYMQTQQMESNFDKAKKALNEVFKDKADDHVKAVSEKNGLSYEASMELAKTNPTLFNNLFVTPFKKPGNAIQPTMGSQTTNTVLSDQSQGQITMEYWNKMRRENPTKYFSVQTQKDFHNWYHSNK